MKEYEYGKHRCLCHLKSKVRHASSAGHAIYTELTVIIWRAAYDVAL